MISLNPHACEAVTQTLKQTCLSIIVPLERVHRQFLEVIKAELDAHDICDINNFRALILCNNGGDELTQGKLTLRGYYLCSKVSQSVKKITEHVSLHQEHSSDEHRSVRVRLTAKGLGLSCLLETIFACHVEVVADGIDEARYVERFWLQ
jgi:DNA-binding MarR family transcriptional regulator